MTAEDARSLLQDAVRVFEPGADVDSVVAIQQTVADTAAIRARQLDSLKSTIRGTTSSSRASSLMFSSIEWSSKVAVQESKLREVQTNASHKERVRRIEEEKFALARTVSAVEEECQYLNPPLSNPSSMMLTMCPRSIERTVRDLSDRLEAVQRERIALEQRPTEAEEPAVRYRTSLYSNISNIRWDFKSGDIKGGACHMMTAFL